MSLVVVIFPQYKMPEKFRKIRIKISVKEAFRATGEESEGGHPLPGGQVARPHPWPRHQGAWEVGPTSGAPLWPIFTPRHRNTLGEARITKYLSVPAPPHSEDREDQ